MNKNWSDVIDGLLDIRNSGRVKPELVDDLTALALEYQTLGWLPSRVIEVKGQVALEFVGPQRLRVNGMENNLKAGERMLIAAQSELDEGFFVGQ